MLRTCDHPGCATLTLGTLCIAHEPPVETRAFPRGRPFPRVLRERASVRLITGTPDPVKLSPAGAVFLGGGSAS